MECWKDPNKVVCKLAVQRILECGHDVTMKCYQDVTLYQCQEIVLRNLKKCNHDATMKCCEDLKNYKCQESVTRKLEKCNHYATMKCCEDLKNYKCQESVTRKLEKCNHYATMKCCEDLKNYKCQENVTRKLEKCNHYATMTCCVDMKTYKCQESVTRKIEKCGHDAIMECYDDVTCYNCQKIVTRDLECGHTIDTECHWNPLSLMCKQIITKKRSCGHEYQEECFLSSTPYKHIRSENNDRCEELVLKEWECGHSKDVKCCEQDTQYCSFQCLKQCENGHICMKYCHYLWECNCMAMTEKKFPDCEHWITVGCGEDIANYECYVIVSKILPLCGHENDMFCHEDPRELGQCEKITSKLLDCGHRKDMKCCQSTFGAICNEIVERKLPRCNHTMEMECQDYVNDQICEKKILKTKPSCGHSVEMVCSDTNFHLVKCNEVVTRDLPDCKHAMEMRCHENVDELECSHIIALQLPHCGHNISIQCSKNLLNHKLKRRRDFLELSHISCTNSCHRTRVCGHPCKGSECGSCTTCQNLCELYCPHADCKHVCGKPCKQCTKRCTWSCPHYTCTKNCDEECVRPRCKTRCPKKLKCDHQCSGFCGEPCPLTCRECNPTEWSAMVDCGEESRDGDFIVRLQECDHEFISCYLDGYFDGVENSSTLTFARCPTCSCIVRWHPRYGNILRKQRCAQQMTLKLISKHTSKQSSMILKPNFYDVSYYIKVCNTFLLSQQQLIQDNSAEVYKQCQATLNMTSAMFIFLDSVKREDTSCQIVHNTYHRMYLIAARWLLIIAMTESLEEENDDPSDEEDASLNITTQTVNTDELGATTNILTENQSKTNVENVKKENAFLLVKEMLDVSTAFSLDELEEVQSLLSPYITDEEQLAAVTKYPVFEGVPGVHIDDWKMCIKGHVEPSSSHRKICIQCEFGRSPELGTFLETLQPYAASQITTLKYKATEQHKDKHDDLSLRQITNDSRLEMSELNRESINRRYDDKRSDNKDNSSYTNYQRFKGYNNRSEFESYPEIVRSDRHSWRHTQMRPNPQDTDNWRSESPYWRQKRSSQSVRELRSNNESCSWRGERTDTGNENWRTEFPVMGENRSPNPVRELVNDNRFNKGKRHSELNVIDDTSTLNVSERHGYRIERGSHGAFKGQSWGGRGRGGDGRGRRRQKGLTFGDFF